MHDVMIDYILLYDIYCIILYSDILYWFGGDLPPLQNYSFLKLSDRRSKIEQCEHTGVRSPLSLPTVYIHSLFAMSSPAPAKRFLIEDRRSNITKRESSITDQS